MSEFLVFLGLVPSLGFVLLYHFTSKWYDTRLGRHLMAYSVAIALLYLFSAIAIFFPWIKESKWISLSLSVTVLTVVWWRLLEYIHVLRTERKQKK